MGLASGDGLNIPASHTTPRRPTKEEDGCELRRVRSLWGILPKMKSLLCSVTAQGSR